MGYFRSAEEIAAAEDGYIIKEDNADYFALVPACGREVIASALSSGKKLNVSTAVIGDGGGQYVLPTEEVTEVVNEVWRGVCEIKPDTNNPTMMCFSIRVPVDVGGWDVREIAVFTDDGTLLVYANAPGWHKLNVRNGTSNPMDINILVTITEASSVIVNINYDGQTAFLKDIENHNNSDASHKGHFTDPNLHFNEERLTRLRMGTNYELNCEKVGGVFSLTGLPEEISGKVLCFFQVPQAYEKNDTWTLNSVTYTVKTADGKGLRPSSFVKDAVLTAVVDTQAKELHFSSLGTGGGGTVVSKTPPDDTDVNWFNPDNRLLSVNVSGEWLTIAGVYGG